MTQISARSIIFLTSGVGDCGLASGSVDKLGNISVEGLCSGDVGNGWATIMLYIRSLDALMRHLCKAALAFQQQSNG